MSAHGDHTGKTLEGRYRVVRLLGKGGMGAVYEGRHVIVNKRVAIKMLHAEFATNEEVLKRFYREAQAAAAIGHKNIIDIMDVGVTPENEPFIVMEYLEGEDLESMLARTGPISLEAACGILEPALQALNAAHAKGIVHRDLKPANIFLVRNEGGAPTVKLIDFGISKICGAEGATKLTQTGSLIGTPTYMSPEQARGDQSVDHRTDIYSMGVIVYQMLTGSLPFEGESYNTLLINLLTAPPRPLREVKPDIPPEAEALVLKELSKDPAARSVNALVMLESFKALAAYQEREAGMTMLAPHIQTAVASGDLGAATGGKGSASSGARVLSQMAKATPGVWSGTAARKGAPKGLVAVIVVAAMLTVGGVAFVIARGRQSAPSPAVVPAAIPAPAPVPAAAQPVAPRPAAAEPEKRGDVMIRVVGAPEGAQILFDGAAVPVNPFPVERKDALVKLEVRVDGYAPFATMIAPSEDREVEVSLTPEAKRSRGSRHGKAAEAKQSAAPSAPQPTPAPAAAPAKSGAELKQGKRGTKFGNEFE
jgi:eukaryotic-like serine/threonine-protein kinase